MKKLFLFMSWVMLILSGCADEDIIERNSPSFPQSVNTRSAGDGVYDILGYGYDITGPYLAFPEYFGRSGLILTGFGEFLLLLL